MPEPKTKKTKASVSAFLSAIENETRRKDAKTVEQRMRAITGEKPAMWGPTIVGYGEYETPSGTWPRIGFSPRKANIVLYIMPEFRGRGAILKRLGKHKTGVTCVYINKLADIDADVLEELIEAGWKHMAAKHG